MKVYLKIFLLLGFVLFTQLSKAQLITDSDRRLKTQETERSGFLFFGKKKKGYVPSRQGGRQSYSLASEPRYSSSSKARFKDHKDAPRYSISSSGKRSTIQRPRYSPGSPFRSERYARTPKYSPGSPWTKNDIRRGAPRYSQGAPWTKKDVVRRSPRYSPGSPWSKKDFIRSPRYSTGSPFAGINWKVQPRYSTNKHRFDLNRAIRKQSRIYNFASSKYKGNYRTKLNKKNTMHPSFAHQGAKNSMETTEDILRKWSLIWSRIDGNKVQPPSVKDNISKPKFDRKETKIWNE